MIVEYISPGESAHGAKLVAATRGRFWPSKWTIGSEPKLTTSAAMEQSRDPECANLNSVSVGTVSALLAGLLGQPWPVTSGSVLALSLLSKDGVISPW